MDLENDKKEFSKKKINPHFWSLSTKPRTKMEFHD